MYVSVSVCCLDTPEQRKSIYYENAPSIIIELHLKGDRTDWNSFCRSSKVWCGASPRNPSLTPVTNNTQRNGGHTSQSHLPFILLTTSGIEKIVEFIVEKTRWHMLNRHSKRYLTLSSRVNRSEQVWTCFLKSKSNFWRRSKQRRQCQCGWILTTTRIVCQSGTHDPHSWRILKTRIEQHGETKKLDSCIWKLKQLHRWVSQPTIAPAPLNEEEIPATGPGTKNWKQLQYHAAPSDRGPLSRYSE